MLPSIHIFNSAFMERGAVTGKLFVSEPLVSRYNEEGKQVAAKMRCEYRQHIHTMRLRNEKSCKIFILLLMMWG